MSSKGKVIKDKLLLKTFLTLSGIYLLIPLAARATAKSDLNYDSIIRSVAVKYDVEAPLIHSIIRAESNYNNWAVSDKGAMGLMQLMPETARIYGVKNVLDPEDNIEGGVKYLKDLIKLFKGRTDLVLAAYNAGQEAVKKHKGIPPYRETREYVQRVKASYGKSSIRSRTQIYRFTDESGRIVLTNDRNLYLKNKSQSEKNTT